MLRRYELTDQQWEQIAPFLPPEKTGKRGRPLKDNRIMLNAMIWIARSGSPWRDLPEYYSPWESVYSRFRKWTSSGLLNRIFRFLAMDAELSEVSLDASIVQAHQHSAGARKDGAPNEIGHSRGGPSTKIHAAVDAYGCPLYIMLSEGQRNDINYAVPVLEHINIEGAAYLRTVGMTVINSSIISMTTVVNPPSLQEKMLNSSVTVTGGSIKNGIWSKNFSLNSKHIVGSLPDMINLPQLILVLSTSPPYHEIRDDR